MADPFHQVEAIGIQGTTAYDFVQTFDSYHPNEGDNSMIVAEIEFPYTFDLRDVLAICYGISFHKNARRYTLQQFNCYFFSWSIILSLARACVDWERLFAQHHRSGEVQKRVWRSIKDSVARGRNQLLDLLDRGHTSESDVDANMPFLSKLKAELSSIQFLHSMLEALTSVLWQARRPAAIQSSLRRRLHQVAHSTKQTYTPEHDKRTLTQEAARNLLDDLEFELLKNCFISRVLSTPQLVAMWIKEAEQHADPQAATDSLPPSMQQRIQAIFCETRFSCKMKVHCIKEGVRATSELANLEDGFRSHNHTQGIGHSIYHNIWSTGRTVCYLPAFISSVYSAARLKPIIIESERRASLTMGVDLIHQSSVLSVSRLERLCREMKSCRPSERVIYEHAHRILDSPLQTFSATIGLLKEEYNGLHPASLQTFALEAVAKVVERHWDLVDMGRVYAASMAHDLMEVEAETILGLLATPPAKETQYGRAGISTGGVSKMTRI